MSMSLLNQKKVPLPWHENAATQTTALQHTMVFTSRAPWRILSSVQGTIFSEATGLKQQVQPLLHKPPVRFTPPAELLVGRAQLVKSKE